MLARNVHGFVDHKPPLNGKYNGKTLVEKWHSQHIRNIQLVLEYFLSLSKISQLLAICLYSVGNEKEKILKMK